MTRTGVTADRLDPTLIADRRAAWIDALRSGRYAQGHGRLRTADDGYCCLGVAEDVRGAEWRYVDYGGVVYENPHENTAPVVFNPNVFNPNVKESAYESAILSLAGARWLGLEVTDPVVVYRDSNPLYRYRPYRVASLAELNDTVGLSFAQIADVIADQPPNWNGDSDTVSPAVDARNEAHRRSESS